MQALNVDFYLFSGHKAYGPTGVGVLYGKQKFLDAMPPYQGGGDMIDQVTFDKTTYNALPMKFEAGTPLIAEVIGLGSALSYLTKIGLSKALEWENELLSYARSLLQNISGLKVYGTSKEKGGIISFSLEGVHPLDLATLMDFKGIAMRTGHLCAQPLLQALNQTALSRISLGLYNSRQDIDYFVESLLEVKQRL